MATPGRLDRLRSERAELQALIRHQPTDRRPAFRQAELSLESAKKDLDAARYRLGRAEQQLEELGPLSHLRSLLSYPRLVNHLSRGGRKMRSEAMHRLEGSQVSVALRDGGRLDDCQLVSAPRGQTRMVWLFDGRMDVFVRVTEIVALWEVMPYRAA